MRKKLFAALALQLALTLAVLLSPFGITQLVEKHGSEAEFRVTEAHLYKYYNEDDERLYQLDLNLEPLEEVEINRRISGTDDNGNYFSYEDSGYANPGFCTYRFRSEKAQREFAAAFDNDNNYYYSDPLKYFVKDNTVTVRIRYFYRYVVVEGVYVNGEDIEAFSVEKESPDFYE